MKRDIIYGIHSIIAALENPRRGEFKLFTTDEALQTLRKTHKAIVEKIEVEIVSPHKLQQVAQEKIEAAKHNYTRAPAGMFLECSALELFEMEQLQTLIHEREKLRLLALDQVTDVNNLAAICRTASFYNCDAIVFSRKGTVHFPPGFFRIASGATEFISLFNVPSLPKCLNKIKLKNIEILGFSEHASDADLVKSSDRQCLVLGAEESGISNAVMRSLDKTLCLKSQGQIKSLNVSVAGAIALEKIFGNN